MLLEHLFIISLVICVGLAINGVINYPESFEEEMKVIDPKGLEKIVSLKEEEAQKQRVDYLLQRYGYGKIPEA